MQAEVARREICKLETVKLAEAGACLGHHWLLRKSLDVPCKSSEVMMILGKSCKGVSESAAIRGPAAQVCSSAAGRTREGSRNYEGEIFQHSMSQTVLFVAEGCSAFSPWLFSVAAARRGVNELQAELDDSSDKRICSPCAAAQQSMDEFLWARRSRLQLRRPMDAPLNQRQGTSRGQGSTTWALLPLYLLEVQQNESSKRVLIETVGMCEGGGRRAAHGERCTFLRA